MLNRSLLVLAAFTVCASTFAHDFKGGNIRVEHPYARPTVPNQPTAGAYLSLENLGTDGDKLIAAASPIAKSVEIHTMSMDSNNIMRMREVGEVSLPPKTKIVMKPGDGYHFMLLGVRQPLKPGDKFPLTLTFDKAGKIETSVVVEDTANFSASSSSARSPEMNSGEMHGHR